MRTPLALILLAALATAQDAGDDYDEFGFPITFDAQIFTRSDIVRAAGVESEEQLGGPLKNSRDIFLMQRLLEKVGELYGIEVTQQQIKDYVAKEIAGFESEAAYYDSLLQRGLSPSDREEEIARQALQYQLQQLFVNGFIARGQRLLPWDPNPTPREILIAYKNDPERLSAGSEVIWRELLIDIPAQDRRKAAAARLLNPDLTEEQIEAKIRAKVEPLAKKAQEMRKAGKSIDEIGKELGLEVKKVVREITPEPSTEPRVAFLQKAKAGETSDVIELARARWSVIEVKSVNRPGDVSLKDPKVVRYYEQMVAALKQQKGEYLLRLRALDKTDIRPARVKRDLRKLCLGRLRQAQKGLRRLGLH